MFFAKFGVQVIGSRWLDSKSLTLSIKVCSIEVEVNKFCQEEGLLERQGNNFQEGVQSPPRADNFVGVSALPSLGHKEYKSAIYELR